MAQTKQSSAKRRTKSPSRERRAENGRSHSRHMVESLEEGFIAEVADMLHAERQLLTSLPKMAQAADLPRLRSALEWHLEETEGHVKRLENVFRLLSHKPEAQVCEGMQGILSEGKEQMQKTPEGPVRDAMIIGSAQKVEHYEIASYGTLCAWAEELGEYEVVRLLEQTLTEEKNADRTLTRIAESSSNREAEWRDVRRGRGMRSEDPDDRPRGRSYDERHGGRAMESFRSREAMEPDFRERRGTRPGRERRFDE